MNVFDKLLKLGIKLEKAIPPQEAEKLLKLALQKKYGTVGREAAEEAVGFGKTILTDPELAQVQAQRNVLRQEAANKLPSEGYTAEQILGEKPKKATSLREMMEELNRLKDEKDVVKKGMAGMAAGLPATQPIDMNPLPILKKGYEGYKSLKDKIFGEAANQMDLTKDKSATEGIKNTLDLVADPVNYIPGGAGVALGALQTGLEFLPDEDKEKKNKFEKLRQSINRTPAGLP